MSARRGEEMKYLLLGVSLALIFATQFNPSPVVAEGPFDGGRVQCTGDAGAYNINPDLINWCAPGSLVPENEWWHCYRWYVATDSKVSQTICARVFSDGGAVP